MTNKENDRLIDKTLQEEDIGLDFSLRPRDFDEYIGQNKVKENLSIFIEAAKKRGEALDHCLFHGPPGIGKTSLAYITAREMGANIKTDGSAKIIKPKTIGNTAILIYRSAWKVN